MFFLNLLAIAIGASLLKKPDYLPFVGIGCGLMGSGYGLDNLHNLFRLHQIGAVRDCAHFLQDTISIENDDGEKRYLFKLLVLCLYGLYMSGILQNLDENGHAFLNKADSNS